MDNNAIKNHSRLFARQLSRRRWLQELGVGMGALVLGGKIEQGLLPAAHATDAAAARLNLFVAIGADDLIHITAHRSEMGQGIRTSLPQVVADELDADWRQVRIVQAIGDQRYGDQNTDGSKSVRVFYQRMREMGASARAMLLAAAAQSWNVPVEQCSTREQRVWHAASGRSLRYGELAASAAKLAAPDVKTLSLKSPAQFRYIGQGLSPVDDAATVRGESRFGIDMRIEGMVYASITRAPVLGAMVDSVDDSAARKVRGVLDVLTLPARPLPIGFKHLAGVAVIAKNTWSAQKGREQLQIKWSKSAHDGFDSKAGLAQLRQQVQKEGKVLRQTGQGRAALSQAAKQIAATYTVPFLPHATLEPPCALARVDGERCEVWAPVQSPQDVQNTLAEEFGFKKENIVVNVSLLGGAFGRKSQADFVSEAVFLAKALKKPVQVLWSRSDDLQHDYLHAQSAQFLQAGLDGQGRVQCWRQHVAYASIMSTFAANADALAPQAWEVAMGAADLPFAIPNTALEVSAVQNHARIGWLRSVCNIQQAFALGSFVDELAHAAKRTPLAMWFELLGEDRLHNPNTDSYKYSNYGAQQAQHPIDIARLKRVLRTVSARAGVAKRLPKGQGWGFAAHRSFTGYVAIACRVSVRGRQLKIEEMHGAIDCGQIVNADRVRSQMEGAMIFGMSLCLYGQIDFQQGRVVQSNFHDMPLLRMAECPPLHVYLLPNDALPGGVGETGVPPVAPAICNAIFAASGLRIRDLPVKGHLQV
ncbi:molybdopterin cofactor-binding domain-containing protein [Massilia sp. W12]|uniref:xanthine dehydrogenase family protein molybdopterin-binding subunit n=1 Tax=Massilia sp. W12 TaxID=3126507 RepID=UPI0030D60760